MLLNTNVDTLRILIWGIVKRFFLATLLATELKEQYYPLLAIFKQLNVCCSHFFCSWFFLFFIKMVAKSAQRAKFEELQTTVLL